MSTYFHLIFSYFFLVSFTSLSIHNADQILYNFKNEPIDVIIPCTLKDRETLDLCIAGIQENGKNIRRIIVISSSPMTTMAEWFDEALFPFSKHDVCLEIARGDNVLATNYPHHRKSRLGWYYQQLLKFYAAFVIPNLSSNVLILDSDTIFLNPVQFLNEHHGGLYCTGSEFHPQYFEHANYLLPGIKRNFPKISGICHHMLMQRPVLETFFEEVEKKHQMPFWQAFTFAIHPNDRYRSGASEYELYFNYVFGKTKQVGLRPLKWKEITSLKKLEMYKKHGFHFVSCHSHTRKLTNHSTLK